MDAGSAVVFVVNNNVCAVNYFSYVFKCIAVLLINGGCVVKTRVCVVKNRNCVLINLVVL